MTSGAETGTSGTRSLAWNPLIWIAAAAVPIALVNATSHLIEAQRRGAALDPREPFVWEFSSVTLILLLAPSIGRAIEWLPPRRSDLARFLLGHAALTIPFSLLHVGGMVALRQIAYALAGGTYVFSRGDLPLVLFYEWRKDALSYAAIAAVFWFFRWRADQTAARAPASPQRIEIRNGATAIFLDPAEIGWVEAAGNYVEFHAGARTHLVRGTLAAWEAKLAPLGFARAHRSRIVNRARIRALKPTPSGDVVIVLDDGRKIAGSRRYRATLESASPAGRAP